MSSGAAGMWTAERKGTIRVARTLGGRKESSQDRHHVQLMKEVNKGEVGSSSCEK